MRVVVLASMLLLTAWLAGCAEGPESLSLDEAVAVANQKAGGKSANATSNSTTKAPTNSTGNKTSTSKTNSTTTAPANSTSNSTSNTTTASGNQTSGNSTGNSTSGNSTSSNSTSTTAPAPAAPNPCPTDPDAIEIPGAGYYMTPTDSLASPPFSIGTIWIYEESNGMPGLQRDDDTQPHPECLTPDTVIF